MRCSSLLYLLLLPFVSPILRLYWNQSNCNGISRGGDGHPAFFYRAGILSLSTISSQLSLGSQIARCAVLIFTFANRYCPPIRSRPINPPTSTSHWHPEQSLRRRSPRMVVKRSRSFVETTSVP